MTNDEARQYFQDKGLTYHDIKIDDVRVLHRFLTNKIRTACRKHEMSVDTMRMSERIKYNDNPTGSITEAYLYMNSHFFTRRECISFNKDGFIGLCGWAGGDNPKPILIAFVEWCDWLRKSKEEQYGIVD